jgi:hypothetical protein
MYAPLSCVLKAIQNVITSRLISELTGLFPPKPESLDQKQKRSKVNFEIK